MNSDLEYMISVSVLMISGLFGFALFGYALLVS